MLKIFGSLGLTVSLVPPTTNVINHTVLLTSGESLFPAHLYNVGVGSTGQIITYLPCVIVITVAGAEACVLTSLIDTQPCSFPNPTCERDCLFLCTYSCLLC